MPRPWSDTEIDALISDYLEMFTLEVRGETYNKAAHNRALQKLLGRSHGSIEMKHQNVSAVLRDIGATYIDGYKPLPNYQEALYDAVVERVTGERTLLKQLERQALAAPNSPPVDDILDRVVDAPVGRARKPGYIAHELKRQRRKPAAIDYVAREAMNAALGARGESWALLFERARLMKAGKEQLAERIEQVSETVGPSAGFDIRSFEPNGSDRLIEVKTTAGPIETGFFVSKHEVNTSVKNKAAYHLYRAFSFNKDPRLFIVKGAFTETCQLEEALYRARVA